MGITPTFKPNDVKARFDAFLQVIEKRTITRLKYLGEECVKIARTNGNYTDQSGNLRSSVGYMIFNNGVPIFESFKQVTKTDASGKKKRMGKDGAKTGRDFALSKGKSLPGYSIIVVAGMNYALAVESGRRKKPNGEYYSVTPKDVLTSAEIYAQQQLPIMLEQLKRNVSKAIKE